MKHTIFIILFVIGFHFTTEAQEYDLKTYLELVKANNGDLRLESNQLGAVSEDTKITKSYLLPNVDVNGSIQRDFTKNFLFINDGFGGIERFRTNFNHTIDLNAVASQMLYDASVLSAVKISKLSEELSKLNYENSTNELLTQAASLYWQSVFLKESITVLEANADLAKEQFLQIKKMHKKDAVSKLQLHQTEAFYKKSLAPVINAKNQYQNLLNELKTLANIPVTDTITLSDSLENMPLNPLFSSSEKSFETQPQIKAIKKEIEIADEALEANKKFWLPKVNLSVAYNYNGQDDDFKFKNNENKLFFGQLNVSIPIFSGFANKAKIEKAQIEKESAIINLENRRRTFLKELKTAENDYNKALESINLHKETISINESEVDIFRKQLKLGVVTPLEFKESRLQLTQNRLELLNSYFDLQIAEIQINRILNNNR